MYRQPDPYARKFRITSYNVCYTKLLRGRHEIADAVRSFLLAGVAAGHSLEQVAAEFSVEHIAEHLYTKRNNFV